jgi:hypothetical protein
MLNSVPREMLLIFKTNDCLRHLDRRLGSSVGPPSFPLLRGTS